MPGTISRFQFSGGEKCAFSRPAWYRLYDISQMYFELKIDSKYIETVQVDFVGATQFSRIWPEPDEVSMSSITYNDKDKISQLVMHGLKFHAKFIELDKTQNSRMFVMSALCSALTAIFIAFLILAIYKTFRVIKTGNLSKGENKEDLLMLENKPVSTSTMNE